MPFFIVVRQTLYPASYPVRWSENSSTETRYYYARHDGTIIKYDKNKAAKDSQSLTA